MHGKLKGFLAMSLVIILALIIFLKNDVVIAGAKEGLSLCANVLIPALFPFMVLVLFISKSSLSYYITKITSPFTTRVLNLPPSAGCAVALSYLGGYPMGLKSASYMFNKGLLTKQEVQRLSLFAVNASPVFIFTAVGIIMMGSPKIGIMLLVSIYSASLLIGIGQGAYSRFIAKEKIVSQPFKHNSAGFNNDFISATNDASLSMLNICGFAIIFSVLYNICINVFNSPLILGFVNTTLEVVISCQNIASSYNLTLLAAIIAFGGFSSIFQVFSVCTELNLSIVPFILARVANAILAFIIMSVLLRIFPIATSVISNSVEPISHNIYASVPASIALIGLASVFVLSLRGNLNLRFSASNNFRK